MDSSSHPKRTYSAEESSPAPKRPRVIHNAATEIPEVYSDAVRKRLQGASRTGQACDRCKERKMKCDTNPIACGPCRQKKLPCFTTDRVTGKAFERGQSDRIEGELLHLRRQVEAYRRKHGQLDESDLPLEDSVLASASPSNMTPRQSTTMPSAIFDGVDGSDLFSGPVNGAKVDIFDGIVDIAGFPCPDMEEFGEDLFPKFNNSRTSVVNTIYGVQRIDDPKLPSREQALKYAQNFLMFVWPYIPVVHRPSFIKLVNKFYDDPGSTSPAEQCCIFLVLAIIAHQSAVRNPAEAKEKMEESHRWLHYALGFYRNLYHDRSLVSVQALTLMLLHARNLPKPGFSWVLSHTLLVRAIELDYHRSPEKITLPESQNNPLAKEMRKRIFWSILSICVTTGTKVGKPAPWHFQHLDCPVPMAIQDDEVSEVGLEPSRSGKCDFWIALHLFKLLPLLTDLYNHVISVRGGPNEYVKTVESLNTQIMAWRQAWDKVIAVEKPNPILEVQGLHVETWAAEFQLILHHSKLCTSKSLEVQEKNLDVCLKSARRLLASFQLLSDRFKGADFTWHSTVAYALGFGATLQSFRNRPDQVSPKAFDAMQNELRGWLRVMSIADLVLRTDNYLYHTFEPRVRKLETEYRSHLVTFETYQDNQPTPQDASIQQMYDKHPPPQQQQHAKNEYLPPQHQQQQSQNHSQHHPQQQQPCMRTPPGPPSQVLPTSLAQQPQYNGYPPPQNPSYAPYQTSQYNQVPQSLAALLNQPPTHQGAAAYMNVTYPSTSGVSAPAMAVQVADIVWWTDQHGNAMWPASIMDHDLQNDQLQ